MRKLNKEIEKKAKALNQWILKQDIVVEYKKYEKIIQTNPSLKELENELKCMQKEIVNLKHQGSDCHELIEQYQRKKRLFDENPLVYNYLMYKQEVNALLNQIQDDINQQLKKKID